jgi:CheY-like chemotaxis protein
LSVDDELIIQKIIERTLTGSGYHVFCAQNAREAWKEIYQHEPSLILLDVLMPEMDGYEFCASLQKKQETSNIPVIFLTSLVERAE